MYESCVYSRQDATCYDHNSVELIQYTNRKFEEQQTFGEVLRLHDIEKFCCCRGEICNEYFINKKLFGIGKTMKNYDKLLY